MRRTRRLRRLRLLAWLVLCALGALGAAGDENDPGSSAGGETGTAAPADAGDTGDPGGGAADAAPGDGAAPPFEGDGVALLVVADTINPGTADYIKEAVRAAHDDGRAAAVLQLDTPGGLLDATRTIVQVILDAPLPVIVYVAPGGARAGSAGTFITLAAHVAAMAPGSNIGAAHPVGVQGEDPEQEGGKHIAQKIENDTVAFIESIAERRGRNVEWARSAVLESTSVPSRKALELGVIDLVVADLEVLLAEADGREVELRGRQVRLATRDEVLHALPMSTTQKFVSTFSHPNIFYLLMMIGVLGILAEVYHPGAIFPGVIGGICLILAFISMQALPINYGGLALILLALALFAGEMFVTSSGLLAIGGAVALVLGSVLLIDSPDPSMRISYPAIAASSGTLLAFTLFVIFKVLRAAKGGVTTGQEGLVGERGVVKEALGPGRRGRVLVHGEYWQAQAAAPLAVGAEVRIAAVEGMLLTVAATAAAPSATTEHDTGRPTPSDTEG